MHRNVSTAKQMDCFAIFAVLREFLRMLYAFDSSRNCVVFAYPNICKRTKKEGAAEAIENNIRRKMVEKVAVNPKY